MIGPEQNIIDIIRILSHKIKPSQCYLAVWLEYRHFTPVNLPLHAGPSAPISVLCASLGLHFAPA